MTVMAGIDAEVAAAMARVLAAADASPNELGLQVVEAEAAAMAKALGAADAGPNELGLDEVYA